MRSFGALRLLRMTSEGLDNFSRLADKVASNFESPHSAGRACLRHLTYQSSHYEFFGFAYVHLEDDKFPICHPKWWD